MECMQKTITDKPVTVPAQKAAVGARRRGCQGLGEGTTGFPLQRRLSSPLSPSLLEKQFLDRCEKNKNLKIKSHEGRRINK